MYKTRYVAWGILFVILGVLFLGDFLFNRPSMPTIKYNITLETDSLDFIRANLDRYSNVLLGNTVDSDTNVIISDSNKNCTYEGFTTTKNAYNSPIALFVNVQPTSDDSGVFYDMNINNSGYCMGVKLTKILDAIYEDKTWEDLNVNVPGLSGKVALYIPEESSVFYPYVRETIACNLNYDYSKVNSIMLKCEKVENIFSFIKNRKDTVITLYPEYLTVQNSRWIPCYPDQSVELNLDLSLADSFKDDEKERVLDFLSSKKFVSVTGLRVENRDYKVSAIRSMCWTFESPKIVQFKENIIEN